MFNQYGTVQCSSNNMFVQLDTTTQLDDVFSWVFLRYPCTRSSAHSMLMSPILVTQHLDRHFDSLISIHCLFLALAHVFPKTKREAYSRLKNFTPNEKWRLKKTCPSLGNLFSLFMIVDSICSTSSQVSHLALVCIRSDFSDSVQSK